MNKKELLDALKRPFPADRVHWRIGSSNVDKKTGELRWGDSPQGQAVCYIDSRDVMKRLDELLPFQWQDRYSHAAADYYICEIGLQLDGEWHWRSNGAGATAVEAEKGGMSDAFKRAAVMWGIGQYLYKVPSVYVGISKRGNTWVLNSTPSLPEWASPEGYDRLILKRKPYTEKQVYDLVKLIDDGDAYGVYTLHQTLSEDAMRAIADEFPHGKKTEYKTKANDLQWKGREIMLETVASLSEMIDQDDSLGVLGILEEESDKLREIMTECLSAEHQDKLSILLEEQAA